MPILKTTGASERKILWSSTPGAERLNLHTWDRIYCPNRDLKMQLNQIRGTMESKICDHHIFCALQSCSSQCLHFCFAMVAAALLKTWGSPRSSAGSALCLQCWVGGKILNSKGEACGFLNAGSVPAGQHCQHQILPLSLGFPGDQQVCHVSQSQTVRNQKPKKWSAPVFAFDKKYICKSFVFVV